jgi:hypothetical protein
MLNYFKVLKNKSNGVAIGLLFLATSLQGCVAYVPQPFYSPAQIGFSTYPSFGYSASYFGPIAPLNFTPRFFGGYIGGFSRYDSSFSSGFGGYGGSFRGGFNGYSRSFGGDRVRGGWLHSGRW